MRNGIWNKMMLVACIATLSVTGCAAVTDTAADNAGTIAAEAASEFAEIGSSEIDVDLENADGMNLALREGLEGLMGNLGSAGGTMKLLKHTVNLMTLASKGVYTEDVVTPVATDFVKGLDDDERMDFLDSWENAKMDADKILNDFDSIKELLSDSGTLEDVTALQQDPDLASKWGELQDSVDAVMASEGLMK